MFVINNTVEQGFKKFILKNTNTGATATVLPACGAMLHAFAVPHNGALLNVIDSYDSQQDFDANLTAKGFKSSKLTPFVCRIKNAVYTFNDKSYTIQKFLLGSSAIHGLLYDAPFTIADQWANDQSAGVLLQHDYAATDKGYPFKFNCQVRYELLPNAKLRLQTTITNTDTVAIPMQDGWHPYFTFGGSINDLELQFATDAMLEFDEGLIPTGKLLPYNTFNSSKKIGDAFFDNCFTNTAIANTPVCMLTDMQQKIRLEIYAEQNYPYLQLYTPPHRNSIAIENLSGAPDGFNNGMGMAILQPGESLVCSTAYKIAAL
jgi:aldose 1-epimerase